MVHDPFPVRSMVEIDVSGTARFSHACGNLLLGYIFGTQYSTGSSFAAFELERLRLIFGVDYITLV
jgi:hypothetical protein